MLSSWGSADLPNKLLGHTVSVKKLKKTDLQPLVDKVVTGLPPWKASMLSKAGRTVLVKVKLSAIPVHIALAISLPPWVIQCIDKRRRAFIWKGSDTDAISGGHCLLAWPRVCRPSILGGLGLPDLTLQGYALRMRWLWFQRTDHTCSWASLPQPQEKLVQAMFNNSITVQIGNGQQSFFWTDKWINGHSIQDIALALLKAITPQTRRKRTVAQGLPNNAWAQDITGALTVQVLIDYLLIWDLIRQGGFTLSNDEPDTFRWKWTSDGKFTTASAYNAFFVGQHALPGAKQLRGTKAPGRCKFFLWLAMHDCCWTAARRKRHNLQDNDACNLCDQQPEEISHLLLSCVFARETWFLVLRRCNLQQLTPQPASLDFFEWWSHCRKQIAKELRKGFDSLVVLVGWLLWKERNQRVFQRNSMMVRELVSLILDEAMIWTHAGHTQLFALLPELLLRSSSANLNGRDLFLV